MNPAQSPEAKAFETASARLLGAGCTLATIAASSLQALNRALEIHEDAKAEYDAAFDRLMGRDPVPEGLTEKCVDAVRAELGGAS